MSLVVDASVVVAALLDTGRIGSWARTTLRSDALSAPHVMPVEVGNVLRRSARSGTVSQDVASLAHAELLRLRVVLFPYRATRRAFGSCGTQLRCTTRPT